MNISPSSLQCGRRRLARRAPECYATQRTQHRGWLPADTVQSEQRQRGGQTGVLHPDLDGNCTALGGIQLQQLAHAKAGEVAQQVVQDDHDQDQQAAGHDLGGVCRNNGADDEHDGGGGAHGSTRTAF